MPIYNHFMDMLNHTTAMVIGGTSCSQDTHILNIETGAWSQGLSLNLGRQAQSCGRIQIKDLGFQLLKSLIENLGMDLWPRIQ